MIDPIARSQLRALLERDRIWSAYALADLDPKEDEKSSWLFNQEAVVLIYSGLSPSVLFTAGEPQQLQPLLADIPSARYIYLLKEEHKDLLGKRLQVEKELIMFRMILRPEAFSGIPAGEVAALTSADQTAIETLFADYPDQPDAYHPRQLHDRPFWGIWEGDELVSVAGFHIISEWAGIAAVGNVFTRPDRRGTGLGTRATGALVQDLLDSGFETIVLNVSRENQAAIRCYSKLGFEPHCQYHEGIGIVS
jgi:ribosomal protein S18 acetylase RimI-like enzyme